MTTVTTLPEYAYFIRFEDGFEIWKGISGKFYKVI